MFSFLAAAACVASPLSSLACACGCGVFDVGTGSELPQSSGLSLYFTAAYLDQSQNWSGTSSAPAEDNPDKHLRTQYYFFGAQEMFNRDWGMSVEVPYAQRHFATIDDSTGEVGVFDHGAIGDIRVMGLYTGFSGDLSTGINFGVKLANGDRKFPNYDRDTQIGTGSTDVLFGGYHQMRFGDGGWSGYVQGLFDIPVNTQGGYRPGDEFDGIAAAYPAGWQIAPGIRLTPLLQAVVSTRRHDSGINADPENTGYSRVLAAPALELQLHRVHLYADVEAPVWQNIRGNQLIAPWQMKFTASIRL